MGDMHMAARTHTHTVYTQIDRQMRDGSESVAVICVTNARHKQLLHGMKRRRRSRRRRLGLNLA